MSVIARMARFNLKRFSTTSTPPLPPTPTPNNPQFHHRRQQRPVDRRGVFFLALAGTGAAVGTISATVLFEQMRWSPPPVPVAVANKTPVVPVPAQPKPETA